MVEDSQQKRPFFVNSRCCLWLILMMSAISLSVIYKITGEPTGRQEYVPFSMDNFKPAGHQTWTQTDQWPATCNLTWFKKELRLDTDPPVIPRILLSKCQRILYNRIPKCASRTFRDIFMNLTSMHNMSHIYIDKPFHWLTSPGKIRQYVQLMAEANGSFILTSHFHFYLFSRAYDPETMVYIDITREPSSWFESMFSYRKYGSSGGSGQKQFAKQTIGECIRQEGGCMLYNMVRHAPLQFLCGLRPECSFPNQTAKTVSTALYNVDHHYLTVGLYEDLPAYMEVLEYIMPHIFSNITQVFNNLSVKSADATRTNKKEPLDKNSKALLRPQLKYEFQLYDKLKKQFYDLHRAVKKLKASENS